MPQLHFLQLFHNGRFVVGLLKVCGDIGPLLVIVVESHAFLILSTIVFDSSFVVHVFLAHSRYVVGFSGLVFTKPLNS